jgi:hypothetical protein
MVPLFLDETIGKPMVYGSKAFVHSVNPIGTKRMDHVHVSNKNDFCLILKKKCGCLYFSFISYFF